MEGGGMSVSFGGSRLVVRPELARARLLGLEKVHGVDLEPHGLFPFAMMEKDFVEMRRHGLFRKSGKGRLNLGVLVVVHRHMEVNQRLWFRRRGTFCSGFGLEVWILGCWGACFAVGSWFVVDGGGGIVVVGFVLCCWLSLLFRVSVRVLFVSVLVVVGVGFLHGFVVVVVGVVFGVFLIGVVGGDCCFLGVDVGGGFFGGFFVWLTLSHRS